MKTLLAMAEQLFKRVFMDSWTRFSVLERCASSQEFVDQPF